MRNFLMLAGFAELILWTSPVTAACGPSGQCQTCTCTYHPDSPPPQYANNGCFTDEGDCSRSCNSLGHGTTYGKLNGACPYGYVAPPDIKVDFCTDLSAHPVPANNTPSSDTGLLGVRTGIACIELPNTVKAYRTSCYTYAEQYVDTLGVGYCVGALNTSTPCMNAQNAGIYWGVQRQFGDVTFLANGHFNVCLHVENQDHGRTLHVNMRGWEIPASELPK